MQAEPSKGNFMLNNYIIFVYGSQEQVEYVYAKLNMYAVPTEERSVCSSN